MEMEPEAEAPPPPLPQQQQGRLGFYSNNSVLRTLLFAIGFATLSLLKLEPLARNSAKDFNHEKIDLPTPTNISIKQQFPLSLSQVELSDAEVAVLSNLLDLKNNDPPPRQRKHVVPFNDGNHMMGNDVKSLLEIQKLVYATLTRWNHLAEDLGIHRWVVHGGSAMGAKCFGGMNPWDDDVDLTVLDCELLDFLWENGEKNVSKHYPGLDERSHSMNNGAALWDSRLIKVREEDMILSRGSRCCNWYKLMSMDLVFRWKPGDAITGVELECMSRGNSMREKTCMRKSGWTHYMRGTQELFTVPFGPTTIKAMEPNILNRYIQFRYGKSSPCQYPFSDGEGVEKFPAALALASSDDGNSTKTTISTFRLDQDQARMDFALNNWYVSKSRRDKWYKLRGDKNQMEYTKQLPNLDKIEIDNTISPNGCTWQSNSNAPSAPSIKVIGWNAERGTHWDKFYKLIY